MGICLECKKERVETIRKRFCHINCARKWQRDYMKSRNDIERTKDKTATCKLCEASFTTKDKRTKYCSKTCKNQARKTAWRTNHGVDNPAHLPSVIAKKDETTLKAKQSRKPGLKAAQIKREQTMISRHGYKNSFNSKSSVANRMESLDKRYNTRSARIVGILKRHEIENYDIFCETLIQKLEELKCNPYSNRFLQYLKDVYNVTGEVVDDVLKRTDRYDLLSKFKSSQETELYTFLKNHIEEKEIKVNTRPPFMKGLELDFYIPSKKIAIEFHGLAFHSERPIFGPKNLQKIKNLHELKYTLCKAQGVNLIQIFEDEWRDKKEIINSMLSSRLGISANKIHARKCEIREIAPRIRKGFFDQTHISGDVQSKTTFGMFYENELVAALSLRNTWNKAYGEEVIEIARFATKLNTQIAGGFSKLMKRAEKWSIENRYESILTYADCRFGQGLVYLHNGFEERGKTKPNYFYERGGVREARFSHRKTPNLLGDTEREQQNNLGWYAIYDAGNNIYTRTLR